MLSQDDLKQIANFILQKSNCHFIMVMYDDEGNRQQFGFGCERCAADILFAVATELIQSSHTDDHNTDEQQITH